MDTWMDTDTEKVVHPSCEPLIALFFSGKTSCRIFTKHGLLDIEITKKHPIIATDVPPNSTTFGLTFFSRIANPKTQLKHISPFCAGAQRAQNLSSQTIKYSTAVKY